MGAELIFSTDPEKQVQFQGIRAGVAEGGLPDDLDRKFRSIVDRLEDSYYGTGTPGNRNQDGWKHDVSNPFTVLGKTFDKEADPAASKVLFDGLHGTLWHLQFLVFHWLNIKVSGTLYTESEYRYESLPEGETRDKVQEAKQFIQAFAVTQGWTGAQVKSRVESALQTGFSRNIDINDAIY